MLGLPKSTEFNKRIPKQKFYENLSVNPSVRKAFSEQIKAIYWCNKLAATTLNVSAGKQVTEIEVFEMTLTSSSLDESVLCLIDQNIPYHILFLLAYGGKHQAVIGYKEEAGPGKAAFKVDRYFHTKWMNESELPIRMEGLSLDAIYENYVRQISGLEPSCDHSLGEQIKLEEAKAKLVNDIALLEKKARNEKQPSKKFEYHAKAKALMLQLSELEAR